MSARHRQPGLGERAVLWPWALVLALLLSQMLGTVHRVAHGGRALSVAAADLHAGHDAGLVPHAAVLSRGHDHAPAAAGSWLQRLFSADGHAEACVLYDQLSHADGLAGIPLLWLPPVWVAALPTWHACWHLAVQATGFLARGPPGRG